MEKSKETDVTMGTLPEILAPAGDETAFLAALAAGADAVYCGLKSFSARQAAKNMTVSQLARLTALAHEKHTKVYVAFNTLITPKELPQALTLLSSVAHEICADALIFQDLAVPSLAKKAGFTGELHLSTLANASHTAALHMAKKMGVSRVVMPREISVDELKQMGDACPDGVNLEVFIHGALCYGISGRCYWSSFMGGKSGLRGACVQPCRRMYQQGNVKSRAYSCTDLGLDALVKVLKNVENVASWKIEGRKKGPHYVYYTTLAYRYLRDHGKDPVAKKEALGLLEMALGRERTHFGFLSHRPWHPIPESGQTASGLFVGSVRHKGSAPTIVTREALISGDLVRVGTEDESWHEVIRIPRSIPKGGTFVFKTSRRVRPPSKTPAFLVDRREPELATEIGYLRNELETIPETQEKTGTISYRYPKRRQPLAESLTVAMHHEFSLLQKELKRHPSHSVGVSLWVDPIEKIPADTWVVLPPVVFPKDETDVRTRVEKWVQRGCRTFVLGDPWQIYWFDRPEKLDLWVGPFCNIANPEAMKLLQEFGVKGVIASPELGLEDYMALAEHAPVGVGLPEKGSWPLSISRIEPRLQKETLFESPKKEGAYWVERDGLIWTYPNWQIDFTPYRKEFERAGYRLFFVYEEPLPAKLPIKKRPGLWNLHVGLS